MVAVESADYVRLMSYLYQIDGVMLVTLKACDGTMPEGGQNALWAAAVLMKQAITAAEELQGQPEAFEHGAGI